MTDNYSHDKMHWGCCWAPAGGKGFWVLGVLAFFAGIVALWQGGEFFGVSYATWYWTALVSGVLSLGAKVSKHHWCAHQMQEK